MKSKLSALCKTCGNCCKCMVLPMKKSVVLEKAQTREWLDVRGCQIVAEDNDSVFVKVDLPCPHLNKSDDGWICDIYDNRPTGCKSFDGTKYDFLKCRWKSLRHVVNASSAIEKGVT